MRDLAKDLLLAIAITAVAVSLSGMVYWAKI